VKKYICAWSSGHEPPRPVYYQETETGWNCTYDRQQATRFNSTAEAWQAWKSRHVCPERYAGAIQAGRIRVELEGAAWFCF
jgi:hypothetical protein